MSILKPSLTRRDFVVTAGLAATVFGLDARLAISPAFAQKTADPAKGFHTYKVGSIEVTAIYDGIWEKPHDPAFIKNASVEETTAALVKSKLPGEFVSVPLTVSVLKIGDTFVMIDSGSGGQWQPTAGKLHANLKAAGIDPAKISTILVSHFHPDHIFGLMEKETNAPVFPNAELVVAAAEYNWWTEAGRVEKLPEGRKKLGTRINTVFPAWKNFRLVDGEKEVVPGVSLVAAPGHTPGHSAFLVSSGKDQLLLSNDTFYVPALLLPNPGWMGAYDQDGPTAVASRTKIADRLVADKLMVTGAHFPFPGPGTISKDGAGYIFTPGKA